MGHRVAIGGPHGFWRGNTCACNMHTFWPYLRDPPCGTSAFDSQRSSTTYGKSQHLYPREKFSWDGIRTRAAHCD
ncbi:unnamed protein product [Acanthoscelides obtectus]|uniref:Uncharacterized protein n=1 Tax=Acanthoscelides obtectus TaxID=200917 RepID=A0A9P0L9U6_ACAOB|nr:unnamed protein product [Acanthoscelides obtectus]CAK1674039.1 hypothetical protein AOBTE_LOCUS29509 [Acanthoscelides obtectus]